MYFHHIRAPQDARDRSDVAKKIVIQLFVEGGIDRNGGADQKQGITIWYCPRDRLNGDIACSAGSIFDDKLLAKPLRQPLGYQPRSNVLPAASGKTDDDAHRPRRIALRPRDMRSERQRGSARGQTQESTAWMVSCR